MRSGIERFTVAIRARIVSAFIFSRRKYSSRFEWSLVNDKFTLGLCKGLEVICGQ